MKPNYYFTHRQDDTDTGHYGDAGREMEHMSNLEFLWRQSFLGKSTYVPNLRALAAEKGRISASVLVYIRCHPPCYDPSIPDKSKNNDDLAGRLMTSEERHAQVHMLTH